MTVIVTDDRIVEIDGDAETSNGWLEHTTLGGNMSAPALDPIAAQGSNSIHLGVNGLGFAGAVHDLGAVRDVTDAHIFVWAFTLQNYEIDANNGVIIGISDAVDGSTNIGAWRAGGSDTNIGNKNNFQSWCVDVHTPFSVTTGLPVQLGNSRSIFLAWDILTSNGRVSAFVDQVSRGSKIMVTGGTSGLPGNSIEIATNDNTNGRGMFQNIGGVFYILGEVVLGDSGTLTSHFTDSGKVWNFEGQHVSATFHKISFVGNGTITTPVNNITFGSQVGTGITANGSGGNTFQAGGNIPFRIEAIDNKVSVNLFGCNMNNAVTLRDDAWRSVQHLVTPKDITREANKAPAGGFSIFSLNQSLNNSIYFGHAEIFNGVKINLLSAKTGVWTVTWEYWNGTAWVSLTDVTDGTSNFITLGLTTVEFTIPSDWAKTIVNTRNFYYVRARISSFTSSGTRPVISQSFCILGGRVRWEQSNATAISGTWTNMDTVVVRNGAVLRKITLVDSTSPIKSAALDLGGVDPAIDTVRDITIIGANKGVLLKGSGNVTYNIRNFTFAGNTNDFRIDFGAGDTVTINLLDATSSDTGLIVANQDNVNGSTVIINNAVTLKVTTKDTSNNVIPGTSIYIEKSSDKTILLNTVSDKLGEASSSVNFSANTPINIRTRKSSSLLAMTSVQRDNDVVISFIDFTTAAQNATFNDVPYIVSTNAIGNRFYIGGEDTGGIIFTTIHGLLVTTDGVGGTIQWQYWNGSSWVNFTPTPGTTTDNLLANGHINIPTLTGWTRTSVNGSAQWFFIRFEVLTNYTTLPIGGDIIFNHTGPVFVSSALREDISAGITDITTNINNSGSNDNLVFSTSAIGNSIYFAGSTAFRELIFDISTAGVTGTLSWEYWNGTIWSNLVVTDNTNHFKNLGQNSVEFLSPSDWITTTVNSVGPNFYVRATVVSDYTVLPQASQVFFDLVRYISASTTGTITSTGFDLTSIMQKDSILS